MRSRWSEMLDAMEEFDGARPILLATLASLATGLFIALYFGPFNILASFTVRYVTIGMTIVAGCGVIFLSALSASVFGSPSLRQQVPFLWRAAVCYILGIVISTAIFGVWMNP
jgi:formate hydrogenlyase subunit 4